MVAMLWADDRYRGAHGIGRYASEVLSRLGNSWTSLGLSGKPGSPLDPAQRLPAERGDLVYSPGYAGFFSRRRQILTVHDLIHLKTPWPGRAKYLAYYGSVVRPAIDRAGVVLTVSETSRAAIREWLGNERVEVVNAGIGCSDAFRVDGGADVSDQPYIQYVGNLRRHKNVDVVLRALATITDVRIRLLLPASEIDEARARIDALGLSARAEAVSGLSDVALAASYRGARATVMPSTLEGFGLPALESIQCGTPVIYWKGCTAVSETVGDRGIAVDDAADVRAWATAIGRLVAEPRRVEPPAPDAYSWDRTAASVRRVLQESGSA
ncbi:MAG: glycosyltransferase family 1 protein [Microbacterium sp.]|nr:MAG: glycosyltransferase family 1 protein [Microbacterium sp.]